MHNRISWQTKLCRSISCCASIPCMLLIDLLNINSSACSCSELGRAALGIYVKYAVTLAADAAAAAAEARAVHESAHATALAAMATMQTLLLSGWEDGGFARFKSAEVHRAAAVAAAVQAAEHMIAASCAVRQL
jgi:hypothetical protein